MSLANHVYINLRKSFPGFELDVDLCLPAKGISVFFGHSGCGKTSLLRCIAGLEQGEGSVLVRGDVWQDDGFFLPTHKRPLGYVFQEANLFPHLNVQSNLEFGLRRLKNTELKNDLDQAIELLGIGHLVKRRVHKLSGGERQRVAIAQALALRPQMLLMDEPLAALDQARKQEILPYLQRLHDELKIPLLYVTHSIDELVHLADHLVVLEQGQALASGELANVLASLNLPINLGEDSSVVLEARISKREQRFKLARADFSDGALWARDAGRDIGESIRLRVLARDVSLALQPPVDSSILNILPAVVEAIGDSEHPAIKIVKVKVGDTPILCRLSLKSLDSLDLSESKKVWVQIKSVAIID
ncbi:MAG: molybdenum ABC transporter ATP-binding protein [Candidatus Sedimenticola endophacoides]